LLRNIKAYRSFCTTVSPCYGYCDDYYDPNIAAHEILAQKDNTFKPLSNTIKHLQSIPKPSTADINYDVAAFVAFTELSKTLLFTETMMTTYQDSIFSSWKKINSTQFKASREYGIKVVDHISKWMNEDHYKETRTMPKFEVIADNPSRWQPTPPNYMDGIEPHWKYIRPIVLESSSQFKPKSHPDFSLETSSNFYKELKEVYDVTMAINRTSYDSNKKNYARCALDGNHKNCQ